MRDYYYIGPCVSNDKQSLSNGIKIIILSSDLFVIGFKQLDGPYNNLNELKSKSKIFKNLAITDSKRAAQILDDKNIERSGRLIFVEKNSSHSISFIKMIEHVIKGEVRKKELYGIHFFNEEKMKIKELIVAPLKNKAWKAIIGIDNNGKILEKCSTFFPINWTLTRLFNECEYACKKLTKVPDSEFKFYSFTTSQIKVEIIIKNESLKSIYPIL